MMERLTWRRPKDGAVCPRVCKGTDYRYIAREFTQNVYDRLAYYEDMEEQGLLVKLPCKIGDTVYRVHNGEVLDWWQIMYIEVYEDEIVLIDDSDNAIVYPEDVGKTAFLCRKDAEQALKGGAE